MAEHQELSDKVFFFNSFACVSSSLLVHLSSRWPSPLITWLSVANHCQESAIKADGTHWVRLWFWGLRHAHFLSSRFRSCCWHRPQVWWQSPRRLLYCSFRCCVLRGCLCHRLAPRLVSRRRGTRGLRSLRLSLHWLALFPAPSVDSSGAAPARTLLDIGRWTFTALSLVAPFQMPVSDHVYQLQDLYLIILRVVAVTKQLRGGCFALVLLLLPLLPPPPQIVPATGQHCNSGPTSVQSGSLRVVGFGLMRGGRLSYIYM